MSAEHLFTKKNMVLLPDSFLVENDKFELIPSMKEFLSKSHLTFGYLKEESARIRNLGALKLSTEEDEIIDFCDKPVNNYQNFNAFWGTFGFTYKYASQILLMMSESIKKKPVDINSLGMGKITGFPINEYYDLGTWDSIHNFDKSKLNQSRSNLRDQKELITKQKRVPVDKVRENYSFAANG